jgi:hypothetical protein
MDPLGGSAGGPVTLDLSVCESSLAAASAALKVGPFRPLLPLPFHSLAQHLRSLIAVDVASAGGQHAPPRTRHQGRERLPGFGRHRLQFRRSQLRGAEALRDAMLHLDGAWAAMLEDFVKYQDCLSGIRPLFQFRIPVLEHGSWVCLQGGVLQNCSNWQVANVFTLNTNNPTVSANLRNVESRGTGTHAHRVLENFVEVSWAFPASSSSSSLISSDDDVPDLVPGPDWGNPPPVNVRGG